jgi:hypothetical protein
LSERHLFNIVTAYVCYFNQARPHQGIAQCIPFPVTPSAPVEVGGEVVGIPVLHGLHHDYRRRAA